jgi:hypothetical protein
MRNALFPPREAVVADVISPTTVLLLLLKKRKENEIITVKLPYPFTGFNAGERVDVAWAGNHYELVSPYLPQPSTSTDYLMSP